MKPATSTLGPAESSGLTLQLNALAHLFNAPRIEPLAPGPLEGLGISGFEHLLNQLHLDRALQRERKLTLFMPAAMAVEINREQITTALRRHAQWRIEREQREMRNTYRYGWKVSVFAVVMLALCIALSSLFASAVTEGMWPLLRRTLEYGFEIIGWVILWHPIDVLVFAPVSIRARTAALQALAKMEVVIRAEPAAAASAEAILL
jgi:hypothetical protein